MKMIRCLLLVALVFASQGVQPRAMLLPDSPGVSRFKALLATPPVIQELVYAQALPDAGRVAVALERGLVHSSNQEFYELRWQTNAMFHRQIDSPRDAGGDFIGGSCFSLWGDRFYFLDARTRPTVYVLERAKAARGVYPDPYHAAHIRMTQAAVPLNLGLHHLYPGSLQWEGQSFRTVSMADKKPIWIQGRISVVSNGIPVELRVQYSNDVGSARYRIAYEYGAYRDPWYPTRIDSFLLRGNTEILYERHSLLSVTASPKTLPESHFGPGRFLPKGDGRLLYLTNNAVYRKLPSGRILEMPVAMTSIHLGREDYYRNRYYYTAAAAWTLLILVLGIRTIYRTKHQTKSGPL